MPTTPNLTFHILNHAGPILRWRACTDPGAGTGFDREARQADLLACPEVRRWLDLLGSGPVHHSKDSAAENALAKLCEYGLRAGMPELDEKALLYCALGEGQRYQADALILAPFLARAGYSAQPALAAWIERRMDVLYEQARTGDYDLYMDESERRILPPSQQMLHGAPKLFYKQHFSHHWGVLRLPTCYDLYLLAYLPRFNPLTRQKIETITAYLLHPAFQETPGGYIWNPHQRQSYAAGRVFLACLPRPEEHQKLVLFLEMLAQIECGRASEWFRQGMAHLETFRTGRGTYCFPSGYLHEQTGYYLYAGLHMGLGESPRNARTLELESSFRMERLKGLAG